MGMWRGPLLPANELLQRPLTLVPHASTANPHNSTAHPAALVLHASTAHAARSICVVGEAWCGSVVVLTRLLRVAAQVVAALAKS